MFVFEGSIIAIGIIGGIANLLMLLILAQSKARKYEMAIVFNQMTLDFLCCLLLVISNVLKIVDIDYGFITGSALCKTLTGESMLWFFLTSSTANLVILTLERYVKIVHAIFHKRYFRQWMYFVAIVLSWINPVTALGAFVDLSATAVRDGRCIIYVQFPAVIDVNAYAVYVFFINFVLPLVVFVFCYSRILQVTRRRVVPANVSNMVNSAAEQKAMKTQMNVIKTFLIISVCFFFCWCPTRLYYFLFNLRIATNLSSGGRNVTVFLAFLNVCLHPFIYAAKLDPVKQYIRQKLFSRGRQQESDETIVSVINTIGNSSSVQVGNHA